MPPIDVSALRRAVAENRYVITRHAQQRMGLRRITHRDLKQVIANGDVVEEYPENRPDPKILFMAHIHGEPLYVSCAFDGECAYIITVHHYDPQKWVDPWTRRIT